MSIEYIPINGLGYYISKEDLSIFNVDENFYDSFYHDYIEIKQYGNSFTGNINYCVLVKNPFTNVYDISNKIENFNKSLKSYDKNNIFNSDNMKYIEEVLIF